MKKRGVFGMIVLGSLIFLLVIAAIAGIYFYNYYVFKEIRICVGEGQDTMYPCENQKECLDLLNFTNDSIRGAPVFIQENFNAILNRAVYCKGSCFVGKIRGINYETGELEGLESCSLNEDEFVIKIHGAEGLDILNWLKSME